MTDAMDRRAIEMYCADDPANTAESFAALPEERKQFWRGEAIDEYQENLYFEMLGARERKRQSAINSLGIGCLLPFVLLIFALIAAAVSGHK